MPTGGAASSADLPTSPTPKLGKRARARIAKGLRLCRPKSQAKAPAKAPAKTKPPAA